MLVIYLFRLFFDKTILLLNGNWIIKISPSNPLRRYNPFRRLPGRLPDCHLDLIKTDTSSACRLLFSLKHSFVTMKSKSIHAHAWVRTQDQCDVRWCCWSLPYNPQQFSINVTYFKTTKLLFSRVISMSDIFCNPIKKVYIVNLEIKTRACFYKLRSRIRALISDGLIIMQKSRSFISLSHTRANWNVSLCLSSSTCSESIHLISGLEYETQDKNDKF